MPYNFNPHVKPGNRDIRDLKYNVNKVKLLLPHEKFILPMKISIIMVPTVIYGWESI